MFGGDHRKTTKFVWEPKKQMDYNSIRIIVEILEYSLKSGRRYGVAPNHYKLACVCAVLYLHLFISSSSFALTIVASLLNQLVTNTTFSKEHIFAKNFLNTQFTPPPPSCASSLSTMCIDIFHFMRIKVQLINFCIKRSVIYRPIWSHYYT